MKLELVQCPNLRVYAHDKSVLCVFCKALIAQRKQDMRQIGDWLEDWAGRASVASVRHTLLTVAQALLEAELDEKED